MFMEKSNQYQEGVKSYPIIGEGELWVKLKFPRDDEIIKRSDFENRIIGIGEKDDGDDDDHDWRMNDFSKSLSWVCHICQKSFSSGKALGGHMRVHVQKPKNSEQKNFKKFKNKFNVIDVLYSDDGNGDDDVISNEQIVCSICRKDFRSKKSLYGHMRCHPDRDWRGINPPSEKSKSSVGLKECCFKGWQVTAKRGRKGLMVKSESGFSSSGDVRAAKCLMMTMADPTVEEKMPSEKRVLEGKLEKIDGEKKKSVNICDHLKPARKKVGKYECSTCRELEMFSSHRALGGDTASHSDKSRVATLDSVGNKSGDACNRKAIVEGRSDSVELTTMNRTGERMMDFDLNALPPPEDI